MCENLRQYFLISGMDSQIIESIGPTDLEYVIRLKIESGKCYANTHDGLQSAKMYENAYEVSFGGFSIFHFNYDFTYLVCPLPDS